TTIEVVTRSYLPDAHNLAGKRIKRVVRVAVMIEVMRRILAEEDGGVVLALDSAEMRVAFLYDAHHQALSYVRFVQVFFRHESGACFCEENRQDLVDFKHCSNCGQESLTQFRGLRDGHE